MEIWLLQGKVAGQNPFIRLSHIQGDPWNSWGILSWTPTQQEPNSWILRTIRGPLDMFRMWLEGAQLHGTSEHFPDANKRHS